MLYQDSNEFSLSRFYIISPGDYNCAVTFYNQFSMLPVKAGGNRLPSIEIVSSLEPALFRHGSQIVEIMQEPYSEGSETFLPPRSWCTHGKMTLLTPYSWLSEIPESN